MESGINIYCYRLIEDYVLRMARQIKATKGSKTRNKAQVRVLGRSAATGRFVLAPVVIKRGQVTRSEAKNAVAAIRAKRKAEVQQRERLSED